MIEIGPNLKEVLISMVAVSPIIGTFLWIYLMERQNTSLSINAKPHRKKVFFSMDNPVIYFIISLMLAIILAYVLRIK